MTVKAQTERNFYPNLTITT